MGAEFIFSVISTLSSLLSSIRGSGATCSADGEEDDGIERDLDRLARLLRRIQAALHDAAEREIRDECVKLWLQELKSVAYEAEDVLDEWQSELLRRQIEESVNLIQKSSVCEGSSSAARSKGMKRPEGFIPDGMAKKIKRVIEKFNEIAKDKEALSLREDDGGRRGSVWTGLMPTSHMVNESTIFGRNQDKKQILDFVLSNKKSRDPISVIAIVGMGGVGKTTLAQLAYNNSRVKHHFHMKAWVYVSPEFDVIRITKEILESINPGKLCGGLTGLSAAQEALVEAVKDQNVFIVLDDVWNESPSKWEQFLEPLHGAKSVKIVMTTRNKAVVEKSSIKYTHNLSCLSENESRLLFEHNVYRDQLVDEHSTLGNIGIQIIQKCAGLPLAIKTIGRVLSYNMDEDSWRHILESPLWESDGKDEIFPALKVSYYSLPSALKPCFLFCSLFPKGSVLETNEIIHMWITHGYIRPCGSKRTEDIGNEFIHELYRRSFLTMVYTPERQGRVYDFKMHDLVHDLAISISMGEIYTISQERYDTGPYYHLFAWDSTMIGKLSCRCSLMRTLVVYDMACIEYPEYHSDMICSYKYLRVLKWKGTLAHNDLVNIAKLKHLRYLELCNSTVWDQKVNHDGKLERLPESITLLFNLVTLRLTFLEDLVKLPTNFGKLINLRFLEIHELGIRDLPESFGQLSNLQYLSISSCKHLKHLPSIIDKLSNLQKLYMSDLYIRELPESFCMLQNLQTLSISECYGVTRIPSGIGALTNLQWIYCSGICVERLPKSMNSLSNLKVLQLSCSGSPVVLLCGFESLLYTSSLKISIKRYRKMHQTIPVNTGGMVSKYLKHGRQINLANNCLFLKSQSLCMTLRNVSHMVKLEINGYQGIGYAFVKICSQEMHCTAIAMHCHIQSSNLFTRLGKMPLLKSLSLVRITGVQNLQFTIPRLSTPSTVLFPSLEELELVDFTEWSGSVGKRDRDFPVLHSLKIENCPKLSSVPNFGNIRRLEIIMCSFSKLELDLLHLQLLESLYIEECLQLITSIQGMQNLGSIRTLCVLRCPLLTEFLYPMMPKHPPSVEIVACPSLVEWCQIQKLIYIKDFSCKTLVISGNWNIMKQWDQNIWVQHLVIQNCIKESLKLDARLQNLTTLEVQNCWKLEIFEGLQMLRFLRRLVLWDCPQLKLDPANNVDVLPSLESLAIHGCHNVLSLNLLTQDQSSFTELEVTDCKLLMCIVGDYPVPPTCT